MQQHARRTGIDPLLPRLRMACAVLLAAFSPPLPCSQAGTNSGPTLHLTYQEKAATTNTVGEFMYFVPLISPEPVTSVRNAGNTQRARILSATRKSNSKTFHASCEFDFVGEGCQRHLFDHAESVLKHQQSLKQGSAVEKQLAAIVVQGSGSGIIEIDGIFTNGVRLTTEVRLRFNHHHPSPVSVELCDIYFDGKTYSQRNPLSAKVNTLTFHRTTDQPRMEISVASVNKKGAKDNLWQSVIGGIKGAAVNLFIPPVPVTMSGLNAMLDFGSALANSETEFTFPYAERLKADIVE